MKEIAKELKRKRIMMGLRKYQVAEKAGITKNSMVNIEKGRCISYKSLKAVCKVLNLKIELIDNDYEKRSEIEENTIE